MHANVTLKESLRLAGNNLLNILNPEDNYLPYWQLTVRENYDAAFLRWWPAHNIGRWLDAMLRLEAAIGFQIPPEIDAAMQENARRFFENPDHISLNPIFTVSPPDAVNKDPQWDLHSLREGMLALNALVRWRGSEWAAQMGRKMVQSLDAKLRDDGTWDLDKFAAYHQRGGEVIHNLNPSDTHGRMLEALVWFYEATGDAEILRFADRLARWHFANTTQPDGAIPATAKADHTHSYFGTLRGLLLYGRLTRQHEYVERVAAAYQVNVPRVVYESGYTSHNMVEESFGETTSPGDAAQLALWLAQAGYGDYLDDADRLVRSRILPSQILDTPRLNPVSDSGGDVVKNLEQRIVGGYGGCHHHPHGGKRAVTDVTAADVHTLIDIYQHVAVSDGDLLEIFFHMDYEDSRVRVAAERDTSGRLIVTPQQDTVLAVRVPHWTPRDSIHFRAGDEQLQPMHAGHFAHVGRVAAGTTVVMDYALPIRKATETGLGVETEILWKGDDIVGIAPNTAFYPFYPDVPAN
ncbi:MAG: hypothetical protein U0521_09490 [Anaerolineae bacterium]